jgi:FKBP-type peptidyl-prolyl cis-trans isomerase FklB
MKFKNISISILISIFITQIATAQTPAVLKTSSDSMSYSFGVSFGDYLKNVVKQQGVEVNPDLMLKGIEEVLRGQPTSIDAQKCNAYIQSYIQNQKMVKADMNKKAGEKFLAENKIKAGVVTTPSGLQYQIIKAGTGAKPSAADKVKVHYHGTLINGEIFDSSVNRGEPATFGVTQVIPGWVEALQMMPVGSKWKLVIPENLAYGAQGPPAIGPNAALVFDVELLEIIKEAAPTSTTDVPAAKAPEKTPATAPAVNAVKKPVAKPVKKQ